MNRPITTLFMLMSVDGKISTGDRDELDVDRDFPLMKEFYPDVKDSIPDIVEMVFLPLEGKSLEEKYICAKKDRYFGETKDC